MTKITKKIKAVKDSDSTPEESQPKVLSPLDFERLERSRLLKEFRNKEQECLRLKMSAVKDKRKLLELTARCYDLDDKLLQDEATAAASKAKQEKEVHDAMLAEIRERLNIKGKFGYNPDTLEVIEDETP